MKLQDHKRINSILYFANKSPESKINRLKLMKLLWLADRIHLNRYGRPILKDEYCALPHGPILSKTMDLSETSIDDVFTVRGYEIEAEDNCDYKYFSKSDLEVMDEVWQNFGEMTDKILRDYSHLFPEWLRFKDKLEDNEQPNRFTIDINDLFKDPPAEANLNIDKERSERSKSTFHFNSRIQEALDR